MKIYLAGPFFNDAECAVKARIKAHLEEMIANNENYELCDPQTAGNYDSWEQPNCEWGFKVFIGDIDLLDECDTVIAIDWGLYGDCGTAWEVGYAYGRDKKVIIISPNDVLTRPHSVMVVNGSSNFITESRFMKTTSMNELLRGGYFASGIEQK